VKYREVRVRGDAWRYDQATKTHVYTGHIVATHGDTTLTADRIAYNEAENTATATGHIRVTNPRNRVEGDTAAVDFNRKIVRLRGENGVRIVALPTPSKEGATGLRNRIKEPVTLDCKAIDYNYRAKTASAEGPVKVSRTNQVLTGDAATYSADDDLISLTGNVHGKDEKNQTFQAPSLKVSLKEGAEWMEAPNVTATFFVKEEPEEQPKTTFLTTKGIKKIILNSFVSFVPFWRHLRKSSVSHCLRGEIRPFPICLCFAP
jgi:lipopolysaccharide assembly outer membrane protein LptD (OstA)